jgi:hypothetical protein
MKLTKLGLLAATAIAAVTASSANATVLISGILTWKAGVSGTQLSTPGDNLTFTFLADSPSSVHLSTFVGKLNGTTVSGVTLSNVTFTSTGFNLTFSTGGGYTLNFKTGLDWTAAFPGTPFAVGGVSGMVNGAGVVSDKGQVSVLSVGSVPEPATWALMLGGFGLAGLTLRGRVAKYKVGYTA